MILNRVPMCGSVKVKRDNGCSDLGWPQRVQSTQRKDNPANMYLAIAVFCPKLKVTYREATVDSVPPIINEPPFRERARIIASGRNRKGGSRWKRKRWEKPLLKPEYRI